MILTTRSNPTPTPIITTMQFACQLTVRIAHMPPRNLRDGSVRFPYQEANSIMVGRRGANIDVLRQKHGKVLTDIKVRIAHEAAPSLDTDIKLLIDHDDTDIKVRVIIAPQGIIKLLIEPDIKVRFVVPQDDAASLSFDTVTVTVSATGQPCAKRAFLTLFRRVRTMYYSALDLVSKKRSERIYAEDCASDLSVVTCSGPAPPPLDDNLSFPKLSA